MRLERCAINLPARSRRCFLLLAPALLTQVPAGATLPRVLTGTYADERLVAWKSLTLPRVHLYDHAGRLVDRERWPRDMQGVKQHAGEAFGCVSDQPVPEGSLGPPPDCKRVVYGERVEEHFAGLATAAGVPIRYRDLPRHRYLVVEYFADWCSPCLPGRRALDSLQSSTAGRDYVAVVVDFSRLPEAQRLARERASSGRP